jgi:hypothetical protein
MKVKIILDEIWGSGEINNVVSYENFVFIII